MASDNPAGRLSALLQRARQQNGHAKIRTVWADVLDVPDDDESLLLRRLAGLLELPEQVRAAVHDLPDLKEDLHLRPLPAIEAALGKLNLDAQWRESSAYLTDDVMVGLEWLDHALSTHDDTTIDHDAAEDIRGQVVDLIQDVLDADLDPHLKQFLLQHLRVLDHALQDYRVVGREAIRRAVEGALGGLMLLSVEGRPVEKSPVTERFWGVISRATTLVAFGNQAVALMEKVAPLMLGGGA